MSTPEQIGKAPELAGQVCTGLVIQEYWHDNRLVAPANVTWIAANGEWHRVCIDTGIVFWRHGPPLPIPDEPGYSWPLIDVGKARGIEGLEISGYTVTEDAGEVRISFRFADGQSFELVHRNDVTDCERPGTSLTD